MTEPGTHDVGGRLGSGAIDKTPHSLSDWEIVADAVSQAIGAKGIRNNDENRRAREDMDPAEYLNATYYERWVASTETILIEKGLLTKAEIDSEVAAFESRWGEP
jgi:nitrile hydratase